MRMIWPATMTEPWLQAVVDAAVDQVQAGPDEVHRFLVRHNLRAAPGNLDGQGLYGLPATVNGVGYERKDRQADG